MAAGRPQRKISPSAGFASELGARVASGIVLAAIVLLATYVGGWVFVFLWLVAALGILIEWLALTRADPRPTLQLTLVAGLVAMAALQFGKVSSLAAAGVFGVTLIAAVALGAHPRDRLWAAAGFTSAAVIALVPATVRTDPALGVVGVLWMFAVVWTTDIAAYFTGRSLGGPKLWPRISPGKTWSGFAGGLLAGTVAGIVVALLGMRTGWEPPLPIGWIALLSAAASVVGQAGDLAESAMKRHFGVKDSGHLIPGHGGVMDRLDAFWAVAFLVGLTLAGARATN